MSSVQIGVKQSNNRRKIFCIANHHGRANIHFKAVLGWLADRSMDGESTKRMRYIVKLFAIEECILANLALFLLYGRPMECRILRLRKRLLLEWDSLYLACIYSMHIRLGVFIVELVNVA